MKGSERSGVDLLLQKQRSVPAGLGSACRSEVTGVKGVIEAVSRATANADTGENIVRVQLLLEQEAGESEAGRLAPWPYKGSAGLLGTLADSWRVGLCQNRQAFLPVSTSRPVRPTPATSSLHPSIPAPIS